MELGNMCFGNSRGAYEIEREAGFEFQLKRLFYAIQGVDFDSYGPKYENNTFWIMPYYWGDCTCGYEEKERQWEENNKHDKDCYRTEHKKITEWIEKQEFKNYTHKTNVEKKLLKELCKKKHIDWNDGRGRYVHCTCYHDQAWAEWSSKNDHEFLCPIRKPNFYYKPSKFELQWYKYPLRDSYMNQPLTLKQFAKLIDICIESLK